MYFYKKEDGSIVSCYKPLPGLYEITEKTFNEHMNSTTEKIEKMDLLNEKTRHLTAEEVTALLIKQQINTLSVDDATALRMLEFYPEWADLAAEQYSTDKAGFRFTHDGNLYKTIPDVHTFGAQWVPGVGTESIYVRIDEEHDGTKYDPIPYDGNMALESGKYYMQDYVIYRCTRDTVNPVYNALADLVGLYVEVTE